jgi:serine/threonine protein kinase
MAGEADTDLIDKDIVDIIGDIAEKVSKDKSAKGTGAYEIVEVHTKKGIQRIKRERVTDEDRDAACGITVYGYIATEPKYGQISVVCRAKNISTGKTVAIKYPKHRVFEQSPSTIDSLFKREAEAIRGFDHPNIIKGIEKFNHLAMTFIVMEYLPRLFLDAFDEKPTVHGAYDFMRQAMDAVCYLHDGGLVHHDIKPLQFMLDSRGTVKLIDFGTLAHHGSRMPDELHLTPGYIYPPPTETGRVDRASDIYALGKTFSAVMLKAAGVPQDEITKAVVVMTDTELHNCVSELGYRAFWKVKGMSDSACMALLSARLPPKQSSRYFIDNIALRCSDPAAKGEEFTAEMLRSNVLEFGEYVRSEMPEDGIGTRIARLFSGLSRKAGF